MICDFCGGKVSKCKISIVETPEFKIKKQIRDKILVKSRAISFNGIIFKPLKDKTLYQIDDIVECHANANDLIVGNENWVSIYKS